MVNRQDHITGNQAVCEGCNQNITYCSPQKFDTICSNNDTGATHCVACCACEDVETSDHLWGTGTTVSVQIYPGYWDLVYKTKDGE